MFSINCFLSLRFNGLSSGLGSSNILLVSWAALESVSSFDIIISVCMLNSLRLYKQRSICAYLYYKLDSKHSFQFSLLVLGIPNLDLH